METRTRTRVRAKRDSSTPNATSIAIAIAIGDPVPMPMADVPPRSPGPSGLDYGSLFRSVAPEHGFGTKISRPGLHMFPG